MIMRITTLIRFATAIAVASFVYASAATRPANAEETVVRIAFLRSAEPMSIARLNGTLEKRLAPLGVRVQWIGPFDAYAPAAEGLNAGIIDITTGSSTSALTSFTGGAPLSVFAYQWDAGDSSGILVKQNSPIKTLADLVGRTVAVNRGGSGDYNLAKALESAHVASDKVKRAYLSPSDSAAAFSQDHVDAWSSWGMYFPVAISLYDARVLALARDFKSENAVVYVVRQPFAQEHPSVIRAVQEELRASAKWASENRDAAAKLWENELKLSPAVAKLFASYEIPAPVAVGDREIAAFERLNDWMVAQKILSGPIPIEQHVFKVPSQ
jgi:sulfonate transport system substrate-binding protein